MPIKSEIIQISDYYRNGKFVKVPLKYIAFIDKNGIIRNSVGDTYKKMQSKKKIDTLPLLDVDIIPTYDIIKTDIILDCKDRIINPKLLVFLINGELYDIWGRLITPQEIETIEVEDYTEPETVEVTEEEPEEPEESENVIECGYIDIDFIDVKDEKGVLDLYVNGNTLTIENDNAFAFDGKTYILTNKPNFEINKWFFIMSFKQPDISDEYMSLVSFSKDGENVLNILTEKYDIFVFTNDELQFIDDIGDNIISKFTEIKIDYKGNIYVNDTLKANVGAIDLSQCNWNFIIGGDYNTDKTVNNYFIGEINKFCVGEMDEN